MSSIEIPTLRSGRPERKEGLENKIVDFQEELDDLEGRIKQVEQLQAMAVGFDLSKNVLKGMEGSGEAIESVEDAIMAIKALEEKQRLSDLLARRRQVKQLIATGRIDLGPADSEQE